MAAYSRAIDINPNNAVYYSNRAAAHVRLENFGLALTDATKAIELNPQYVKVCWHPSGGGQVLARMHSNRPAQQLCNK